jgi:hypothetical protein
MVGKTQVVAKPDDAGRSGFASHQGGSTRKARLGSARGLQPYRPRHVLQMSPAELSRRAK